MMFESMTKSMSIFMSGAEILGWKEQEEVEKVQEKYLRGVLGVVAKNVISLKFLPKIRMFFSSCELNPGIYCILNSCEKIKSQ
jgi:hypothetical protein